ncbi:hypothetical protein HCZ30_16250 [Marivivens donghaensis]|uniref:Uncharacterized protein n=1 Tax=Marivivens donghaensis TaxID=1699413 RepID=A0ABX0W121_9RHOB|nr:hypothetical protein [Marivivens donghaensis]NIY73979.1 hypothetical protein [Marivivens donghaensis]
MIDIVIDIIDIVFVFSGLHATREGFVQVFEHVFDTARHIFSVLPAPAEERVTELVKVLVKRSINVGNDLSLPTSRLLDPPKFDITDTGLA